MTLPRWLRKLFGCPVGFLYTCANCRTTFETDRPDEEALEEMRQRFGDIPEEERIVVCDDCYQVILRYENLGTDAPTVIGDGT